MEKIKETREVRGGRGRGGGGGGGSDRASGREQEKREAIKSPVD